MNRRTFLDAIATATVAGLSSHRAAAAAQPKDQRPSSSNARTVAPLADRICLFTDHLDDFDYGYVELAQMLRQLKVAGPDLTVRPGGLVPPERVTEDLPRAVRAFRDAGLRVPMISTGLTSASDPSAANTLTTAGKLGIRYFKLGYYHYDDVAQWQSRLQATRKDLQSLLALSKRAGMVAGFHNHSGPSVGGALWDSWELLGGFEQSAIGFYFDPAQAMIEGANHAWKLGLARLAPRLVMVAIKDFVWEKSGGQWRTRWVPLGQGMVRWSEFFAMLRGMPFEGPISLHIEYDPGGANKVSRFDNSLVAAQRDLDYLRRELKAP